MLTGRRHDETPTDGQKRLVERLQAAVARRRIGVDQTDLEQPPPDELSTYIAELEKDPAAAGLVGSGAKVALVDLSRVLAAQPLVHIDHAEERVSGVNPSDVVSVARISLPITQPVQLPATFDHAQKAWVLTSANPNLRITGVGQSPTPNGPMFGFTVALLTSFVRVAWYQQRYILVDGYHRAHGFLRLGINVVPAFISEVTSFEALGLPTVGMLPQDTYLRDRPPVRVAPGQHRDAAAQGSGARPRRPRSRRVWARPAWSRRRDRAPASHRDDAAGGCAGRARAAGAGG